MKDFGSMTKQQHAYELLKIRHYLQLNLLGLTTEMLRYMDGVSAISDRHKFEKDRMESTIAYLDFQYENIVGEKWNEVDPYKTIL